MREACSCDAQEFNVWCFELTDLGQVDMSLAKIGRHQLDCGGTDIDPERGRASQEGMDMDRGPGPFQLWNSFGTTHLQTWHDIYSLICPILELHQHASAWAKVGRSTIGTLQWWQRMVPSMQFPFQHPSRWNLNFRGTHFRRAAVSGHQVPRGVAFVYAHWSFMVQAAALVLFWHHGYFPRHRTDADDGAHLVALFKNCESSILLGKAILIVSFKLTCPVSSTCGGYKTWQLRQQHGQVEPGDFEPRGRCLWGALVRRKGVEDPTFDWSGGWDGHVGYWHCCY